MTTYNTGNPVPSADARDRYDNSQTLDEVVNGGSESYTTRTGKQVISLVGMNSRFNNAQDARESAFNLSQEEKQEEFQSFIDGSGWSSLGAYGAGVVITSHTQTVDYQGQPYQLKPSIPASLQAPYVTTGVWATEGVNFKLVGDNSLRQDLALDGATRNGYTAPYAGATFRTVQSRLAEKVSIFDLVPVSEHAAIKAGTSTYDASSDIAKAAAWGIGELDFGDSNNTITMNSVVTFTKSITLTGRATIKAPATARAFVFAPGFALQTPIVSIGALANYPAFGGNAVTPVFVGDADAANWSRGDIAMISSDDVYPFATSARKAELMRVLEVVGTTVYLHGFLKDTYTTNKTLTKLKEDRFSVGDLRFTSQGDPYAAAVGAANGVVRFVGAVRPVVTATFENLGSTALNFTSCWHPMADVRVMDLRDKLSISAFGYGIIAYGATRHGRFRIEAERVRHAYTGGVINSFSTVLDYGTARNNTIFDSLSLNATAASFDTHPGEYDAEFRDCRSIFRNGDADSSTSQAPGYQDRGCDTRYVNCGVEGVAVGWEFLGASQLHGKENITELHGCWTKTSDRLVSPAIFNIRTKVAPEACSVRVFGGVFNGGEAGGILSIEDGAPNIELRGPTFYDILTMRMGANNNVSITKCDRINRTASVEPIILGGGTTLTIDNYFADATSYSSNQLIRSGIGTASGAATVNAGRISANNRNTAVHPIGTNSVTGGTATVAINRIDAFPQQPRRGNTAGRPVLTTADIGYAYYDTTLSKFIMWDSLAWVVFA